MRLVSLCVAALLMLGATTASADTMTTNQQYYVDQDWKRTSGGIAGRPYIKKFSGTDAAGKTTVYWEGITKAEDFPPIDYVTKTMNKPMILVQPVNLCPAGTAPQAGHCYAEPNRVALRAVCTYNSTSAPMPSTGDCFDPETTYAMEFELNGFSELHSWTWVNGDWSYFKRSGSKTNLKVDLRVKPAVTATSWDVPSGQQCCTCDMPANCDVSTPKAMEATIYVIFSMAQDGDVSDDPMAGCLFGSTGAIHAGMVSEGDDTARKLRYALTGVHYKVDGKTLNVGTMKALLPDRAIARMWGKLRGKKDVELELTEEEAAEAEKDAKKVKLSRTAGDGSNELVTYKQAKASSEGHNGLLVTVDNVTFSVPEWSMASEAEESGSSSDTLAGDGDAAAFASVVGVAVAAATLAVLA